LPHLKKTSVLAEIGYAAIFIFATPEVSARDCWLSEKGFVL
jgi:hypothetical protein